MRFTQYHAMCPAVVRLTRYHHVSCLWWGWLNIMLCVFPVVRFFQYHVMCPVWWGWLDIIMCLAEVRLTQYHVMCPVCGEVYLISCYVSCLWWCWLNIMLCVLPVVRLTIMLCVLPVVRCIWYHIMCPVCGEAYSISCNVSCLWWGWLNIMLCPACGEVDSISCYVSYLWWGWLNIILCVLPVVRFTQYHAMCPVYGEV